MFRIGYTWSLKQKAGAWFWEIRKGHAVVADGFAHDKAEAEDQLKGALLPAASKADGVARKRAGLRLKLRYLVQKRPYLVAAVCESLLGAGQYADVIAEAEEGERAWWERESPKTRQPLPTHHRALTPIAAAQQAIELFEGLGYVVPLENGRDVRKLKTFIRNTFGGVWFGLDKDEGNVLAFLEEADAASEGKKLGKRVRA